jgi:hypothetical protein
MAVPVKRHGYRGMPQQLLDELRVDAAREQQSSTRVPKIVQRHRWQPGGHQQGLEAATVHHVPPRGCSLAKGEYEPVVFPEATQLQPVLVLALTVASEGLYSLFGEHNGSSLANLRGGEARSFLRAGKGAGDAHSAPLKVNVLPSQPQKLAYPQTRRYRHNVEGFEGLLASGG